MDPKEVIVAANNGGSSTTNNSVKSASSAASKTANSESAKSASSATVKTGNDEGAKSSGGDSKNNSLDFYVVRQAGFVRQLFIEPAGVHTEDAAAVFNGQSRTNILAALDYTPAPTLLPTATIEVDGNATDWAAVTPAIVDPAGDQKGGGNASTDLTQVSIVRSADKVALLMKVAGNFAFPYAPERDYSNYEVALHFFSNGRCLGNENGFLIANNFTSAAGENTHRLDYYFSDSTSDNGPTTTVASSGSVLETSFYFDQLPSDKGDYVTLSAVIHSFTGGQAVNYDLNDKPSSCYKIR